MANSSASPILGYVVKLGNADAFMAFSSSEGVELTQSLSRALFGARYLGISEERNALTEEEATEVRADIEDILSSELVRSRWGGFHVGVQQVIWDGESHIRETVLVTGL